MEQVIQELTAEINPRSQWALKKVKDNEMLNKLLDESLKKIFSKTFYSKIKKEITKKIKIREANLLDVITGRYAKNAYAFVSPGPLGTNTIYIERKYLHRKSKDFLVNIILHELLHIMQNSKRFLFFFNKFPELRQDSLVLEEIIKKNLKKDIDFEQFFGYNKGQNIGDGEFETIAHMIAPNKLRLGYLVSGGKKRLIKGIKSFNIFNLRSSFWKERLNI